VTDPELQEKLGVAGKNGIASLVMNHGDEEVKSM
jgi:hypothetical protein